MPWIKAFHIIFMVTWFAGLFYLPRLFVYHADTRDGAGDARFQVMERKLLAIMTLGAVLTAVFGFWLLAAYAWSAWADTLWLPLKLALVAGLVVYHWLCARHVRAFREGRNRRSHVYFRWFNEVPALALIAVVVLAVVKPF